MQDEIQKFSFVQVFCSAQRVALLFVAVLWASVANAQCNLLEYSRNIRFPDGNALPYDLTSDSSGVLVTGHFRGTMDFNSTAGVDVRVSATFDLYDIYLTKFSHDGTYAWTYTSGAEGWDSAYGVISTRDEEVLITGHFERSVDFNPGPGSDIHTAPWVKPFAPRPNAFVTRLTKEGGYRWTRSFEGPGGAYGNGISLDPSESILLTGTYFLSVDFDPGVGTDVHTSPSFGGIYVTKLTPDGNFVWARTIGATSHTFAIGVGADGDGNVLYAGEFTGLADFDPGEGIDQRRSVRVIDNVFVTKLDPDGGYLWTRTYDLFLENDFAVAPDGGVFLTGGLDAELDVDPTAGVDVRRPTGGSESSDVLVSKLNGDGSYGWTYTVGGVGYGAGEALAVEPGGGVLVAGYFQNTVDFDASAVANDHTCSAFFCEFLLRLHADGTLDWVRTAPNVPQDPWRHLALDRQGNLYMTRLLRTVDADPTCGLDPVYGSPPFDLEEQYITKLTCTATPGDFDGNSVVDLLDLAAYQSCFTGNFNEANCATAQALCQPCAIGCDVFDLRTDNALDLPDFAALQNLLTGPR